MAQSKSVRLVTEAALDTSNVKERATSNAALAPVKTDVAALKVLGGLNPGNVNDATSANLINTKGTLTETALSGAIGEGTGVTAADPAHTTKILPGAGKNGLFVRNEQSSYAVKIDQYATGGVHDAVNIAALFGGAHTPFSVNSMNETLSTVKIVNSAAQAGGVIIAAVGDNPLRTASLFGADNHGTGPSYLSTMKGGNGIAFRAQYDPGAYTNGVFWATAHHVGGHLLSVENDGAHTSGSMLRLSESSASATVPIVSIANAGSGESISAPSFNVLKDGRVKLAQIENLSSFNNATLKMQSTGAQFERNVADSNPVLRVKNNSASSTGDAIQVANSDGSVNSRFISKGYLATKGLSTPPVAADLVNNEMTFTYNGDKTITFLAKDSTGTTRTGTVTLA